MTSPVLINDSKFKFVVVGGGTAGWLTALYMRQYYPHASITLIESPEIGILGAGEGTTPHFVQALQELNISVASIINHANGTFKNGIKFTGWNTGAQDDYFYHGFYNINDLNFATQTSTGWSEVPLTVIEQVSKGETFNKLDFSVLISDRNAVKFIADSDINNKDLFSKLSHYKNVGDFALHFDATLLAEHLKYFGRRRNINIISGTVEQIINDKDGYIAELKLKDGPNVSCNFVFDCTGFKRLIIGKHYKSKWKSYKDYLPVNRALPFFVPIDSNAPIPPYTEAIAMKYGWMWKIPTRGRFGCGYVFDSNQISDEQAKIEIDRVTGIDTPLPRAFSFEAGVYKKQWIKNCVAIGLSSGFVEPLEATSIWVGLIGIRNVLTHISGITERDESQIEHFNTKMIRTSDDVLTFLHYHYLTNRVDTPFWKDFAVNNKCPEFTQELIANNKDVLWVPNLTRYSPQVFPPHSWYQVGAGNRFFNQAAAKKALESHNQGLNKITYNTLSNRYLKNIDIVSEAAIDHKKMIQYLLV